MGHRRLPALVTALVLLVALAPAGAVAQTSGDLPDLDEIDPVRHDYDSAIVEHAQVTTRTGTPVGTGTESAPTDTRIWVDIIRPDTDEPVPTILIASPYFNTLGRGWKGEFKNPHQGPSYPTSPGTPGFATGEPQVPFPEWYDEYFVPRGYAVALMDLRGTRNSSGCQVYGDRDEVHDTVDVIDWIADQSWSNGKVGMTGGSYDGTIAIGAAAEAPMSARHPEALSAIIPIRAIDRWYDYHFFNGVQSSSHLLTPALFTAVLAGTDTQNSGTDDVLLPLHVAERKACIATLGAAVDVGYATPYQDARADFWRERDFLRTAGEFNAATFVIHGLFDFNVKTNNAGHLWEALPPHLPKKLWLPNMDHADPHAPTKEDAEASNHIIPFPFQDKFIEATHRWYLEFLKGVDAGATDTPEVEIQRADGAWDAETTYPAADGDLVLYPTADGGLTSAAPDEGSFAYADGDGDAPSSVVLEGESFAEDTRISGQFAFDWDVAAEGRDATLATSIVAVPPGVDPASNATIEFDGDADRPVQLSYAWLRAYYRDTVPLRGVSTPTDGSFLEPGTRYDVTFGSLYTDVVVPAGWRLAAIVSSSAGGTVSSEMGGDVTVFTGPDASRVFVPVVGAGDDGVTVVTNTDAMSESAFLGLSIPPTGYDVYLADLRRN